MITKHTLEQLREMPDRELAELTAKLRGYKERISVFGDCEVSTALTDENGVELMPIREWSPADNVNQAYGLLVWAAKHGIEFSIEIDGQKNRVHWTDSMGFWNTVPGCDARTMCYAFVLAMQEVKR